MIVVFVIGYIFFLAGALVVWGRIRIALGGFVVVVWWLIFMVGTTAFLICCSIVFFVTLLARCKLMLLFLRRLTDRARTCWSFLQKILRGNIDFFAFWKAFSIFHNFEGK